MTVKEDELETVGEVEAETVEEDDLIEDELGRVEDPELLELDNELDDELEPEETRIPTAVVFEELVKYWYDCRK